MGVRGESVNGVRGESVTGESEVSLGCRIQEGESEVSLGGESGR